MPKLSKKPMKATPPNTPNARASPLGLTPVDIENRPPDKNGPMARPAAERVCARPFSVPRTECVGAEFVICSYLLVDKWMSEGLLYKKQCGSQTADCSDCFDEKYCPKLNPQCCFAG